MSRTANPFSTVPITIRQAMEAAIEHQHAGRLVEAERLCRQVLARQSNHPDALHILGILAGQKGRTDEALELIGRAIHRNPTVAAYHCNLGSILKTAGRIDQAIIEYRDAIRLRSDFAEAYCNLADALKQKGQLNQAITAGRQAIQLKPTLAEAHHNLGIALQAKGVVDEAIASYRQAFTIQPNYVEPRHNYGNMLLDQGRYDEAMEAYRHVLANRPDLPEAHWSVGQILLTQGNFKQGWQEYEWRWQVDEFRGLRRNFPQPRWDGSNLAGRRILVHAEQGFGDAIQFIRYVFLLAQRGGKVSLECHPELVRLLECLHCVREVVARGQPLLPFDLHVPLLSLPLIMNTTLKSIPASMAYLAAPRPVVEQWRQRLPSKNALLKVGLVWKGQTQRTLPPQALATLAEIPGVWFCSLQKEDAASKPSTPPPGLTLTDWTGELQDFADTAALITNLDLVITVDTAVAHLAGALGKPVWVLLRHAADWRWLRERSDSPWYPTMRLFRQNDSNNWDTPIRQIAEALRSLVSSGGKSADTTIQRTLDAAMQHHRSGNPLVAESLYRQILDREPNRADALHPLGLLAVQAGRPEEAIELIGRAIAANPLCAGYHCNLGNVLKSIGRIDQAIAAYRQAVALDPELGAAYTNLGLALKDKGELEEAIVVCRRAVQLQPELAETHNNLGIILTAKGQLDDAIAACRRAIELKPSFAPAHSGLGAALAKSRQHEPAIAAYRRAIELEPTSAAAYNNLGLELMNVGKPDEGIAAYRKAIALQPDFAEAHNNLGLALICAGQLDQAVIECRRAVEIKPEFTVAQTSLGLAAMQKGDLDQAAAAFRTTIELRPDDAQTHHCLANILKDLGQIEPAVACLERAMAIEPNLLMAQSSRLYMMLFHPDFDASTIRQAHAAWNRRDAEVHPRQSKPHANDPDPNRRLRIGYVSADFRDHVIGRNMLPLLKHHEHGQFEIHCFASVAYPDPLLPCFQRWADKWHDAKDFTDAQLADRVYEEGIDILVDWTLHMAGTRLHTFAHRPAPVQVTFAGYPGSTGLSTIDYRLTDPYLDPPGASDADYCEQSVRLPDSFWCYDPESMMLGMASVSLVAPLPAQAAGHITFGCLGEICKANDGVLALWAKVMKAVPGSQLLLQGRVGSPRARIWECFDREGIASTRVQFVDRQPRERYLDLYNRIDLVLDTFPYNGHTTSLDALWMGVPVVTLVGQTVVGRAGLSQLTNLGLTELIAHNPKEYVELATTLARDLPRLKELRSNLRPRMLRSPLTDAPRFARNIESAYRQMWRQWCATRQ